MVLALFPLFSPNRLPCLHPLSLPQSLSHSGKERRREGEELEAQIKFARRVRLTSTTAAAAAAIDSMQSLNLEIHLMTTNSKTTRKEGRGW